MYPTHYPIPRPPGSITGHGGTGVQTSGGHYPGGITGHGGTGVQTGYPPYTPPYTPPYYPGHIPTGSVPRPPGPGGYGDITGYGGTGVQTSGGYYPGGITGHGGTGVQTYYPYGWY